MHHEPGARDEELPLFVQHQAVPGERRSLDTTLRTHRFITIVQASSKHCASRACVRFHKLRKGNQEGNLCEDFNSTACAVYALDDQCDRHMDAHHH